MFDVIYERPLKETCPSEKIGLSINDHAAHHFIVFVKKDRQDFRFEDTTFLSDFAQDFDTNRESPCVIKLI